MQNSGSVKSLKTLYEGGINPVNKKPLIIYGALVTFGCGSLALAPTASAGMFNMMNPSQWFGNNNRYDDDYYYDRYRYGRGWGGYGGPYGYGPGWGGYGPYGYGAPYGYGGWPGYGGYNAPKSESPPPPPLPQ